MDLNAKCKTIKLLEDNIEKNLDDLGFGNNFLKYKTKVMIHEKKELITWTS